jgi:hypothetical protein
MHGIVSIARKRCSFFAGSLAYMSMRREYVSLCKEKKQCCFVSGSTLHSKLPHTNITGKFFSELEVACGHTHHGGVWCTIGMILIRG